MTESGHVGGALAVITNWPVFRASAALPAAGAWDTDPLPEIDVAGYDWLELFMTYTQGEQGGGGSFAFRIEVSYAFSDASPETPANAWFRQSLYAPGAMVAGTDVRSNIQREDVLYTAVGDVGESFVYGPVRIVGGVNRMRIPCAEVGLVGTPGTVEIIGILTQAPA